MIKKYYIYYINFWRGISVQVAFLVVPLIASHFTNSVNVIASLLFFYNIANITSSILFGRLSDKYGRRPFIILGTILPGLFFFLHLFVKDIFSLLVIRTITGFGIGILAGSLLAYVYETKTPLGRASGIISLGFGAGGIFVSYIKNPFTIIIIVVILSVVAFFISFLLKESGKRLKIPFFSFKVFKENIDIYVPFFLRHFAFISIWTIYPLFLLKAGIPRVYIGWFYFTNSFFQFLFMPIVEKFNSRILFITGIVLSGVSFIVLTSFKSLYFQWGIQFIIAFSWSCLYMGAIKTILKRNVEKASASGLFSAAMGLAGIVGASIPTFFHIELANISLLRTIGFSSISLALIFYFLTTKFYLTKI